jgi:hypothetical protein
MTFALFLRMDKTAMKVTHAEKGKHRNYVEWTAEVGPDLVIVKINMTDLDDHLGRSSGFDFGRARKTLLEEHEWLQELAQAKYRKDHCTIVKGQCVVTLNRRDFKV